MCGIYGTTFRYDDAVVKRKLDLMRFRGPNHSGMKRFSRPNGSNVILGHVRLSIIDLDERSNQPFVYNDRISIVFNGEIYNYKELRTRFLSDVKFRTESDTEVICAMYEKLGVESVKFFNGMFAYAIYDSQKNIIVGARDRLGKKPFYYWYSDKGFEFASQPKVIHCGNVFNVDDLARKFYLLHGWIPDPYSIFADLKKLRAGQYFTYNLDMNKLIISQYWDLFCNSCDFTIPQSYNEAKDVVKELLYDSVRLRLNANVPVGMFLSGGIDSSLVSMVVSKFNNNISAYTIGFKNGEYDETEHATSIARHLNIPIRVCTCSDEDSAFDDISEYFDEPFCDPSMIPTSLVAQKASEHVTVVLGGDGGDELFYGYSKYEWLKLRVNQYDTPYWLRKMLAPYYRLRGGKRNEVFATQRNYGDVYRSEGVFIYDLAGCELFDRIELGRLLPDMNLFTNGRRELSFSDYDMKFFMNAVNVKVDRATMRSSLEMRSPIMDYRIAEYSRIIPYEFMCRDGLGLKSILKDILYDNVPRELLERPKKGFTPPTYEWFQGNLKREILQIIEYNTLRDILPEIDSGKFMLLLNSFYRGENIDARILWAVYVFIKWYKKYI